jgi:hypothetical protein
MGIQSIQKGLVGANDINWDIDGVNSLFTKRTSSGNTRTDKLINAGDMPITAATRLKKYADQETPTTKGDIDVDAVLNQILDNLEKIGLPDTTNFFSIAGVGGALTIQAAKITATELASNSVTTVKINDGAVTNPKLGADAVDGSKLADDSVDSEHYVAGSIDNEHLAPDIVGIDELNLDNSGGTLGVFSHSGKRHTCVGGAATETVSGLSGLVSGDLFIASFNVNTNARNILTVEFVNSTSVLITASGVIAANDIISVVALRPTIAIT